MKALQKYVSDSTADVKKDFKNLKHIFKLIQIEVQCIKNYFKIFLSQEDRAPGNNIEKEP